MWQEILQKAGAAAQAQDWPTAERTLLDVAGRADAPPAVWFQLGKVMFLQRKLGEAAIWFRKAAEAVPNVVDGWLELGRALAADGQFAEAVEALHRALAIDSNHPVAHRFACVAAREAGDIPTANHHAAELDRLGEPL